jgi:hypothetical protein
VPAFVLASEQFERLAKTLLKSKVGQDTLAVMIPGNPAYAQPEELRKIADEALGEMARRLQAYPAT